ncbi:MAG TPA: diguanylate cyclase, partial [Kofleriaceae bacterium]|nr:diguanylate cyclase [Kofleriaceae bacterium]
MLARLSAHALDRRAHGAINELQIAECAEVLEILAWPAGDTMAQVALWLGPDAQLAKRRARYLRDVLEAYGGVAAFADPAQTSAVIAALQRFAYHLGTIVEARAAVGNTVAGDASRALVDMLQRHLDRLALTERAGLLLVHCASVDRVDALRGLRAGEALLQAIHQLLRHSVLRPSDMLHSASRDELSCLLQPLSSEGVAILAAQKVLRVLDAPIAIEDFSIAAEPRIGVALFPEHGKDAAEL